MNLKRKLAEIRTIQITSKIVTSQDLLLEIKGNLPDPAWQLEQEMITYDNKQKLVTIKIWATRNPSITSFHVIKEFTKTIKIDVPEKGIWTISCNDKILEININ